MNKNIYKYYLSLGDWFITKIYWRNKLELNNLINSLNLIKKAIKNSELELEELRKYVIINKETRKTSKKLIEEIKTLKKKEKKYSSMITKEKEKKLKSLKKFRGSEIDENLYNEGFMVNIIIFEFF